MSIQRWPQRDIGGSREVAGGGTSARAARLRFAISWRVSWSFTRRLYEGKGSLPRAANMIGLNWLHTHARALYSLAYYKRKRERESLAQKE